MSDDYNTDADFAEILDLQRQGQRDAAQEAWADMQAWDDFRKLAEAGEAPAPPAPGETPPPESPDVVESVRQHLEDLGPEGQQLAQEWGDDLAENVAYARHAWDNLHPDLQQQFSEMRDNPRLVKLAAQIGRNLAHGAGEEIQPIGGRREGRQTMASNKTTQRQGGKADLDATIAAMNEAMRRGDRDRANQLSKQADQIAARTYGGKRG